MRTEPRPASPSEPGESVATPDVGAPSRNGRGGAGGTNGKSSTTGSRTGKVGSDGIQAGNGHLRSGLGDLDLVAPHPNGNGDGHARELAGSFQGSSAEALAVPWEEVLPEAAARLRWALARRVKRVLDFTLALAGLVVLLPLMAVVALAIRLTSRGPVIYACEYVGLRGRRFRQYKFRTMVVDAESRKSELLHLNHMKGPAFKIRNDPRVTRLGRFLRKYSIDELPQLWNVVRGDMSLVGPRPPLPEEWERFQPWHRGKLAVTPGITCYWQISGRSEIVDFDEWVRLDLAYIRGWSLGEDLRILLKTIPAVLRGRGAY